MPLTDLGFERPTYDEILEKQIERAKLLFGEDIETAENTPLGKYIRLNCKDLAECYEILETVYYSRFIDSAKGQSLDRLCPFAGISRNQATRARHKIKFTGTAGETIPGGFLLSAGEVQFYTINDYVIGEDGTATGYVDCTESGTVGNVGTGKINTIVESSIIVYSIEHLETVSYGDDIETDAALRIRFKEAAAGSGSATADAIRGAISRVPLVESVTIIENDTGKTVDGRPPNSFECYVLSPESQDQLVADAIFSKKPLGIKCVGSISNTVYDKGGRPHTVYFSRTIEKVLHMKVTVNVNGTFEADGENKIKDNIAKNINALKNGGTVYISSIFGYIHEIPGVVNVPSLTISEDGETYSASDINVGEEEVARVSAQNISVTVEMLKGAS